MKKYFSVLIMTLLLVRIVPARADEGMWLPILLGEGTEAEMQRLGMKISAEDIYSLNKPCIKDAVVLFGGGCTAEIVSDQGLILTNHHCGRSAIQAHSTLDLNYLANGFWAANNDEELANPGLKVSILLRMEDVTNKVLTGINNKADETQRQAQIKANCERVAKEASEKGKYTSSVETFYYGNQYILVIYQVFRDVRLVGAPPVSIGNFGGDTDNWMWPRHTGDFSVFRIYADKDNQPANYDKSNVPYKPAFHLSISTKGIKENDFTFIVGFPGQTQEYLASDAVDFIANTENPALIRIREKRLDIMDKYMKTDKLTRLKYSAKYYSIGNFWKKMIGEAKGIKRLNTIAQKKELEKRFTAWVNADKDRKLKYGSVLASFTETYKELLPYELAADYFVDAGLGIEIVRFARNFYKLVDLSNGKKANDADIQECLDQLKATSAGFFKNYDTRIDQEVMAALLQMYYKDLDPAYVPDVVLNNGTATNGDFTAYTAECFKKSFMVSEEKVNEFLMNYKPGKASVIKKDPIFILSSGLYSFYAENIYAKVSMMEEEVNGYYRKYMRGLMEMDTLKHFYPDANLTMRVTYGKIGGYHPRDAVDYSWFTTLPGIMKKEDTAVYDYLVDPKLKTLCANKDYGQWADADGNMHVCFIASNHTTGGNSGSPVLNAEGQLIGINFDRVWEGTMSDIAFDPERCRNIAVDIRYCLFIIDKFAGSKRLIDEMTLVK